MIRRLAASAALVLLCLAGCDDRSRTEKAPAQASLAAPDQMTAPASPSEGEAAPAPEAMTADIPAAPGAPAYAALYPGAALDQVGPGRGIEAVVEGLVNRLEDNVLAIR